MVDTHTFSFCIFKGYVPTSCRPRLHHAFVFNKLLDSKKDNFFGIEKICGVRLEEALINDIQRYYKCKDGFLPKVIQSDCNDKGMQFPVICSSPPCDTCAAFPGKII